MKYIIAGITALALSGCMMSTPAISEYRLDTKIQKQDFKENGCKKESLKVAQAFSSTALMSLDMKYGLGTHKQFNFSQSQWAESPNRAITSELLEYIQSTNLFKNVQISKSRSRNAIVLETNIAEFMQYFSEDEKESFVKIAINLTLIESKNSSVLDTKRFISRVQVENMDANSGVKALNIALENILNESGIWLSGVCK